MNIAVNQLGAEILSGGGVSHACVDQLGLELLVSIPVGTTYDVFSVTTMPASPGPSSIQVSLNAQTAVTDSTYSGEVLTGAYETGFTEVTIFLPDIQDSTWQAEWIAWLVATVKAQGVFTLQPQIEALIPAHYSTGWWRLKPGPVSIHWTVGAIVEALTFTVRSLSALDVGYLS